jgi:hypothetical protein
MPPRTLACPDVVPCRSRRHRVRGPLGKADRTRSTGTFSNDTHIAHVQALGAIVRRPQLNPIWLRRILHTPEHPISANWFKERAGKYVRPNPEKGDAVGLFVEGEAHASSVEAGLARAFAVIFFQLLLAIAIAAAALDRGWARFWPWRPAPELDEFMTSAWDACYPRTGVEPMHDCSWGDILAFARGGEGI